MLLLGRNLVSNSFHCGVRLRVCIVNRLRRARQT